MHKSVNAGAVLVAALLLSCATGLPALADDHYETTTSITTYATRHGVLGTATPAFTLGPLATAHIERDPARDRYIKRVYEAQDRLRAASIGPAREDRPINVPDAYFDGIKFGGAVVVGCFSAPAAVIPAATYGVAVAALGLFKPFSVVIDGEIDKDELLATLYFQNRAGRLGRPDLRGLATYNDTGFGDFAHYTWRHIQTASHPVFAGYLLSELTSFFTGQKVTLGIGPKVFEEGVKDRIGDFVGSRTEKAFLTASAPSDFNRNCISIYLNGRTQCFPKPIIPATIGPKLEVKTYIMPATAPYVPYVRELQAGGATALAVQEAAPRVVVVRPVEAAPAAPEPPMINSSEPPESHAIDLPTSVEIHGFDFKINR